MDVGYDNEWLNERKMIEQDAQEPNGKLGRKWPSKMLKKQVEDLVELMILWIMDMIEISFIIECPLMCYEKCVERIFILKVYLVRVLWWVFERKMDLWDCV